jgi:CheY-like chemotaxis protein
MKDTQNHVTEGRSLRTYATLDAVDDSPWVLVAEDDPEMRRLLVQVIGNDGFRYAEAGSGLELYDTLRRSHGDGRLPAMVISDIRMPGLNGLEVLGTVREWGLTMPIVLITAFGDAETIAEADRLGATAVLTKPFDMDDLRTAIMYLTRWPLRAAAKASAM